jgi:tetratricopeptide (TPR) repeat protein
MNQIRIARKKERNQARIVRFVMWYCFMLLALAVIQLCTGVMRLTLIRIFLVATVPLPLCVLADFAVDRLGSGLGGVLSGWSSRTATVRATLKADMQKATYSKREGRFQEALSIIDDVLDKDPEFPDALFLKAQILWEGFGNRKEALGYLKELMQVVPDHETLHRWALSYHNEITGMEK